LYPRGGIEKSSMDLNEAIRDALCKAAERLGGGGEEIRALPRAKIYDRLEDLDADRHLLAVVGSWGDTLSDDQVLASLQRWNRGEPPLDYVIASTGGRE
jgi:hypothetical protein